ncbi:MAG: 2-oxoglutarate dehydrogenase, subunit, dihydrolipoamide succinyltransferase [Verrucomicrobiales bacterium]|nr:2-oxoglutarate dehydrogenase, subunit, dihydrolipoamide succinyltransferase [Verrucomicrobiales bacterium]
MAIELKVPSVGESITEVEIGEWLKHEGDAVEKDENVVALESEKATVELPAPVAGILTKITKRKGDKAQIGETIAEIDPAGKPQPAAKPAPTAEPKPAPAQAKQRVMPAAQRLMAENQVSPEHVEASGPGGRVLKEDVLRHIEKGKGELPSRTSAPQNVQHPASNEETQGGREEEVVRMTSLRRTVSRRLVEAQHSMAMLTTFNEIDMSTVMALRKEHQEAFTKKHGVKLGFMSFFVRATIEALKATPQLNASIRGDDIVYHNYFDIGVAIGSGKGLVVPSIRNAERMSFAEVEKQIGDYAHRAQENKLKPDELQPGTFTITNGGIYGSLLSTPIVNPPQSGILGMHTIQERPIAVQGQVVIRPMMYIALSYDHRLVDGREAVTFLKHVKDSIESPARILLEL